MGTPAIGVTSSIRMVLHHLGGSMHGNEAVLRAHRLPGAVARNLVRTPFRDSMSHRPSAEMAGSAGKTSGTTLALGPLLSDASDVLCPSNPLPPRPSGTRRRRSGSW